MSPAHTWLAAIISACTVALDAPASPSPPAVELRTMLPEELCVTLGKLSRDTTGMGVDAPKMRAIATLATAPTAEVSFTYLGPTTETALLGSGKLRRQIGLKLHAQDTCNLVYVMWRLEPVPGIVVSVKRNPGMSTHAECGNGGYQNLKGTHTVAVPRIALSSTHTLRASIQGDALEVWADGAVVWQGDLGERAHGLEGPIGIRTDNARFHVTLSGSPKNGASPIAAHCGRDGDD